MIGTIKEGFAYSKMGGEGWQEENRRRALWRGRQASLVRYFAER